MKIRIDDGTRVRQIVLPNLLVFNRVYAGIASHAMQTKDCSLPPDKCAALFRELRRFARKNPGWVLVDVKGSDGEKVKITL